MVCVQGQTERLTNLDDLPKKAKIEIKRAPAKGSASLGAVRAVAAMSTPRAASATVVKAGSPRVVSPKSGSPSPTARVVGGSSSPGTARVVTAKGNASPKARVVTAASKSKARHPRVVTASPRVVTAGVVKKKGGEATVVKKKAEPAVVKKPEGSVTLMIVPSKSSRAAAARPVARPGRPHRPSRVGSRLVAAEMSSPRLWRTAKSPSSRTWRRSARGPGPTARQEGDDADEDDDDGRWRSSWCWGRPGRFVTTTARLTTTMSRRKRPCGKPPEVQKATGQTKVWPARKPAGNEDHGDRDAEGGRSEEELLAGGKADAVLREAPAKPKTEQQIETLVRKNSGSSRAVRQDQREIWGGAGGAVGGRTSRSRTGTPTRPRSGREERAAAEQARLKEQEEIEAKAAQSRAVRVKKRRRKRPRRQGRRRGR